MVYNYKLMKKLIKGENMDKKTSLFCLNNVTTADLEKMLQLQYDLNSKTAGKCWTKGVTAEGRKIFWHRCMMMEAAELIDSFSWKHWKDLNAEGDELNAKIELVDIWHFLMSFLIEQLVKSAYFRSEIEIPFRELNETELLSLWQSKYLKEVVEKLLPELNNAMVLQEAFQGIEDRYERRVDNIADDAENFMELCNTAAKAQIDNKDEEDERFHNCISLLLSFVIMSRHFNLNIKDAYEVKNVLNEFRQLHGYKNGVYIKMWRYDPSAPEGSEPPFGLRVEDNKIAFDRIAKGVKIEHLLEDLERIYSAGVLNY